MVYDLVRLILMKILHSVGGGDVEQWLEPRNISSCLRLLTLSLLTLLSYLLTCTLILFTYLQVLFVL